MKHEPDPLERLLRAAARAPRTETGAALFALEARVLGGWRSAARVETGEFLVLWLRRAAIGACCLALVSLAWNLHRLAGDNSDELAVADLAMRMGVEQ